MTSDRTILLTGGSGVLGQALLEKLAGFSVICLVHRKPVLSPVAETIQGDVAQPNLGLTREQVADLARRVDYIVHSAAATGFGEARATTFRVNVEGTRNVLRLANDAGATLCHISTAFADLEQMTGKHLANAYEESKLEAEDLVRRSGVPYAILRPSVVVGDSEDGRMSRFQGFHLLCELMVRDILPSWVTAKPTAYLDFVPQDVVAGVVAQAAGRDDFRGEYWLTAGDRALKIDQALRLWQLHIPRLTGQVIKPPRYVDPDVIDRLVRPVFLPTLPARTRAMIDQALELLSFSLEDPLPSSMPDLEARLGVAPMQDPELTLIRNVEFWAQKRGFMQSGSHDYSITAGLQND
jgi:nucleoside-diphosphate-sugar epimerase